MNPQRVYHGGLYHRIRQLMFRYAEAANDNWTECDLRLTNPPFIEVPMYLWEQPAYQRGDKHYPTRDEYAALPKCADCDRAYAKRLVAEAKDKAQVILAGIA